MSLLEKSGAIEKMKKMLSIYIFLYIPIVIFLCFFGYLSPIPFYIEFSIILATGLITTAVLLYFGRKLLLKLGNKRSALKQNVSY
jgi:hypothetical protein